jgi:CO/xanthine dehydrogenase Mo-binding subunit
MPTDNAAKGVGEGSLPMLAPCVGNALFKLNCGATSDASRALDKTLT